MCAAGDSLEVSPYSFSFQHESHKISDADSGVIWWATLALFRIAQWLDGAKTMVDARALDSVLSLLESKNLDIRGRACEIVGMLATHEPTAPAVLKPKPCATLVSLLWWVCVLF